MVITGSRMKPQPLRIGIWAGVATDNLEDNAARIEAAITAASQQSANLVLTPECALSGYPGAARESCHDIDCRALAQLEARLHQHAASHHVGLLLGSVDNIADTQWSNDVVWCDPQGLQRTRYRKRCLTPMDRQHFVPGTQAVCIDYLGWRLGLTICFDVRFPHIWADCVMADCNLFINVAHMAGSNDDHGAKPIVIPSFYSVRAAEWATPIMFCNTGAADRWLDSGYWDHRGMPQEHHGQDLAIYTLPDHPSRQDWHRDLRQQQLQRWQQRGP
ncbi:MAG: carbon-nitrogen hydrolase family protein [Planctomycetota bacterium]|nr:MAG: carbon-nitrogen hydrolase family protein [Planctomycetota bacterium]